MGCLGWFAPQHSTAGPTGHSQTKREVCRALSLEKRSSSTACPIPQHWEQESSNHYANQAGRARQKPVLHSSLLPLLSALPLLPTGSSHLREQQR